MDDVETQMALERIEVAVTVEQRVTLFQAECRYDAVDCLANSDAPGAKLTVIVR